MKSFKKNILILMVISLVPFLFINKAESVNFNAIQAVLNGITVPPPSSVNASTDYIPEGVDAYWSITGSGGSISTIVVELAGYAGTNKFGIYDKSNPAVMAQIFNGASAPGAQAVVSIKADGSVYINFVDTGVDFAANNFGFYLDSTAGSSGGFFRSDTNLNADQFDHMFGYFGNNIDQIQLPGLAQGLWTDNEIAFFWEDLFNGGDQDYNDFVVMVESVTPSKVPEPISLILLGSGLAGAGLYRRLRKPRG